MRGMNLVRSCVRVPPRVYNFFKVNYFVVTDHNEWHRALYQPIEPALHNKVGCPAMGSVTNRIFNVKPLISLDMVFGHQNTELYYNKAFDKK